MTWFARLKAFAYRLAFTAARCWWFVRRPHTYGAIAAIWHDGCVLIVKPSYRRHFGMPGGFVKRGEAEADAVSRELAEELQVQIPAGALTFAWRETTFFEYRHDTTSVWEVRVASRPEVRVDGSEIVSASWKTPAEARALPLSPGIFNYLGTRLDGLP